MQSSLYSLSSEYECIMQDFLVHFSRFQVFSTRGSKLRERGQERKQTIAISLSGSVSVIQPYSSSLFLATGIFPGSRGEISTLCAWMACTFTLQHYIQHIHCRLAEFRQQQASNYCATLVKKTFMQLAVLSLLLHHYQLHYELFAR